MTYLPTKEEIEKLWFTDWVDNNWVVYLSEYPKWNIYENGVIIYTNWRFYIWWEVEVYPESKSDIETLIRLFTND